MKRSKLICFMIIVCVVALCAAFAAGCKKSLSIPEGLQYDNETFSWNAVDGADGYMVHFNEANEVYITETSVSVNDTEVNSGLKDKDLNTLYVRAVTVDDEGNEKATSEPAAIEFDFIIPIKKEWKVTLDLNYANSPEAQTVTFNNGDKFSKPVDPERFGWEFGGWFHDKYCLVLATGFTVTADTTVYAKWTLKEGIITTTVYFYGGSWEQVLVKPYNGAAALFTGEGIAMVNVAGRDGWFKADIDDKATNVAFTNGADADTEKTDFDKTKPYCKDGVWTADLPVEQPEETEYTVTITVNDGEPQELNENPKAEGEFVIKDVELKVGDKVVITINGKVVSNYDADSRFYGTATVEGKYSFYVTVDGISVDVPNTSVEESPVVLIINDGKPVSMIKNENPSDPTIIEYSYIAVLKTGDTVTIKEGDDEYTDYDTSCGFNGTATVDGQYSFYAKKYTDGSRSVWVGVPELPVEVALFINGDNANAAAFTLNKDNKNTTFTEYVCTATLKEGDKVTIKEGNKEYNNYEKECNFTGEATVDGDYTFYFKKYKDGGDSIWVTVPKNTEKPVEPAPTTSTKVYYYNSKGWTEVYLYYWNYAAQKPPVGKEWPGTKMERVGTSNWYVLEIQPGYDMVIFHNNKGGDSNQTKDLVLVTADGEAYYKGDSVTEDRPEAKE